MSGVGALWAWAIVTLLLPIVGLVVGLVYLFRNRIGPGLALIIEAAVLFAVYAVLLSSASAAIGDKAGMFVGEWTWGTPACGTPAIEVSTPTDYLESHGSGYFDADPEAWADASRCAIVLNPEFTIHTAARRCHIIVHEWGHLAGHGHSTNQRSVMYGDDLVSESREFTSPGRWHWVAANAFPKCALATAHGTGFG